MNRDLHSTGITLVVPSLKKEETMNKYIQALTLVLLVLGVASLPSIWLYMEFGIWFVIDELFIGLYAMHLEQLLS